MKYFLVVFLAGGLSVWSACSSPVRPVPDPLKEDSLRKDSMGKAFFPVGDYLRGEILHVDSVPMAIRKYIIEKDRRDSGFIQPEEFNALARSFLLPEFGNGSFQKYYQESSFMDGTSKSITLTYSTRNKDLPLKRVDVLASPGDGVSRVRSIYLEKTFIVGDTSVLQRMYWEAGRNFQIISRINVRGQAPVERQLKVVWDTGQEEQ